MGERSGRDRSRSRERRRRSRSPRDDRQSNRSRDDRRRGRSRSPAAAGGYDPDRKRRRPTWFDIPPVGGIPPPISSLPGAVEVAPSLPGGQSGVPNYAGGPNQQATRHARRIYVGGLPERIREEVIGTFFNNALAAVGGTTAGPGPCVVNVYINAEKKFAFVEFRTVEEASNAMALDCIMFEGGTVRIRRPGDYNPTAAAALGPSAPNPNLNLAAIGLDKIKDPEAGSNNPRIPLALQPDQEGRIFVGGLPRYLSEPECRELVAAFGAIKFFNFIRDRNTGESKGYGFVQYEDPSVVEIAIAGLHGMRLGDRTLTVKKAEPQNQRTMDYPQRSSAYQYQPAHIGTAMAPPPPSAASNTGFEGSIYAPPQQQPAYTGLAPRVVKLVDAVTMEELQNDEEYTDILEDMKEELGKYGVLNSLQIPRPQNNGGVVPGVGKVLAEFADPTAAMAARNALHGRKFGGRIVQAALVTDEDYSSGRWD